MGQLWPYGKEEKQMTYFLLAFRYPATGNWDAQFVTDTFWPEDAEINLTIPPDECWVLGFLITQ